MLKIWFTAIVLLFGYEFINAQVKSYYPNKQATCGYVKITQVDINETETIIYLEINSPKTIYKTFKNPLNDDGFIIKGFSKPKDKNYFYDYLVLLDYQNITPNRYVFLQNEIYSVIMIFPRIEPGSFNLIDNRHSLDPIQNEDIWNFYYVKLID